MTYDTRSTHNHPCCNLSWRAILAGAFVGLGLGFLLNLFGVSIGLTAFTTSKEGLTTLAVGGFIGLAIVSFISMFVAGWVAGHLGGDGSRYSGAIYGFTTWSVALVLTAVIAAHFGEIFASPNFSVTKIVTDTSSSLNLPQNKGTVEKNVKTTDVTVNSEKAVNILGTSLFLTFVLFLIGAIAACLGGYAATRCCREEENKP